MCVCVCRVQVSLLGQPRSVSLLLAATRDFSPALVQTHARAAALALAFRHYGPRRCLGTRRGTSAGSFGEYVVAVVPCVML